MSHSFPPIRAVVLRKNNERIKTLSMLLLHVEFGSLLAVYVSFSFVPNALTIIGYNVVFSKLNDVEPIL